MTNNQLTEEELQTLIIELQQTAYRLNGTNSAYLMSDAIKPLRELQERRKAAMDSEPVAIVEPSDYVTAAQLVGEGPVRKAVHELYEGALRIGDKLYRHAQQPVVPDKMTYQDGVLFVLNNDMSSIERGTVAMRAWNACRAAMLAAAPHDTPALNSLQSVDSVAGKWIPVSERMPEGSEEVLCAKEFDGPGGWRKKVGYLLAGKWTVYGASWAPTHWMPIPNSPQEAK